LLAERLAMYTRAPCFASSILVPKPLPYNLELARGHSALIVQGGQVDLIERDVQPCMATGYDGDFPAEVWNGDRGIIRHSWIVDARSCGICFYCEIQP
jgi:hypothetical protein